VKYTGSTVAQGILNDFDNELKRFVKVMPTDYRRVLEKQAEVERKAKELGKAKVAVV